MPPFSNLREHTTRSNVLSTLFRQIRNLCGAKSLSQTKPEMAAPTIVIVPGLWLGTRPYGLLVDEMKKKSPSLTDFVYAPLVSTGKKSPGNPTMLDDAMGIREVIRPLVEGGKRLVIIGHSSGAFLSAMATEDLEVGQRLATPSNGGVERFIFITGGILPAGAPHPPTNWETKARFTQAIMLEEYILTLARRIGWRSLAQRPRRETLPRR